MKMSRKKQRNRPIGTSNNVIASKGYEINKFTMFKERKANVNHLGNTLETIKSDNRYVKEPKRILRTVKYNKVKIKNSIKFFSVLSSSYLLKSFTEV